MKLLILLESQFKSSNLLVARELTTKKWFASTNALIKDSE